MLPWQSLKNKVNTNYILQKKLNINGCYYKK